MSNMTEPHSKKPKLNDDAGCSQPDGSSSTSAAANSSDDESYSRVDKNDLYMILALLMEDFPIKKISNDKESDDKESDDKESDDKKSDDKESDDKKSDDKKSDDEESDDEESDDEESDDQDPDYQKVGAALVLPNNIIWAVDCSRDGVHAAARLLMKHPDKAKGSKIYISRKPCSLCTKLLVQAKVERVLYLPFEPEYYREDDHENNEAEMKQVDALFTASPIAQTKFVPQVKDAILKDAERKRKTSQTDEPEDQNSTQEKFQKRRDKLYAKYNDNWMENVKEKLPWPSYDKKMKDKFRHFFVNVVKWIAMAEILPLKGKNIRTCTFEVCNTCTTKSPCEFNPETNDKRQARNLLAMARCLAQRTDDPKTGVGAIIVNKKMDILALGWNGFPQHALFGEFPRGSAGDTEVLKKYPYVIHAEQNTILMRNTQNMEGAILFVTKTPCNECTPFIKMSGIKTVVVDEDVKSKIEEMKQAQETLDQRNRATRGETLSYEMFCKMVNQDKIVCYQTK